VADTDVVSMVRYVRDRACDGLTVGGLLAGEEARIAPHDHFGIPAELAAVIESAPGPGEEPLVILDAVLRPAESGAGP